MSKPPKWLQTTATLTSTVGIIALPLAISWIHSMEVFVALGLIGWVLFWAAMVIWKLE